jgi:hypothetical protein
MTQLWKQKFAVKKRQDTAALQPSSDVNGDKNCRKYKNTLYKLAAAALHRNGPVPWRSAASCLVHPGSVRLLVCFELKIIA